MPKHDIRTRKKSELTTVSQRTIEEEKIPLPGGHFDSMLGFVYYVRDFWLMARS